MATTLTFFALGTTWWIELFEAVSTERRDGISNSITALLSSIETRFSRFTPDSLVSRLNHTRNIVTTDPDFNYLITESQAYFKKTNGIFNVLIGEELLARGYDAAYTFAATNQDPTIGNPIVDLTHNGTTWSLTRGQLDLGGIGKGWAIDQVATLLRHEGIEAFLINGGGDMYGSHEHGEPITLYLEHPKDPQTYLGTTTIKNQGFAASSRFKRLWSTKDGSTSHIVGSETATAASFIIADSALTADVLATTALLLPSEQFTTLATTERAAAALFSLADSSINCSPTFPFTAL